MLGDMKICLSAKRKEELEKRHDETRDGQVRDRIKARLLAFEGWTAKKIAQALRIHETTVHCHLNDFQKLNKPKPDNAGSKKHRLIEQTKSLIKHLEDVTYHQIVAFFETHFGVRYRFSGMNKCLNKHGFTYKKRKDVPHKFDEQRQADFIVYPPRKKIHLILDGAGYHRTERLKDCAHVYNIELHYLSPYSSKNPIERLWKVMNEEARNNVYFKNKQEFSAGIKTFFSEKSPEMADKLSNRLSCA